MRKKRDKPHDLLRSKAFHLQLHLRGLKFVFLQFNTFFFADNRCLIQVNLKNIGLVLISLFSIGWVGFFIKLEILTPCGSFRCDDSLEVWGQLIFICV
jgi:hypothetical protein